MKCQACKIRPIKVIEKCDDEVQPYELCMDCHRRLHLLSLRPIEWYNLASIHTFNKYLLHDDFYEDDGEATQPDEDIEFEYEFKSPSLGDVEDDIHLLIDYSIAKWWLENDVVVALKRHNKQELLQNIQSRFEKSNNYFVKERLIEVASRTLGRFCSDWIRERWKSFDGDYIIPLSIAAYYCLPFQEGYSLVKNVLESIPEKKLPRLSFSCLYLFRTPFNLDWIESKLNSYNDFWGSLAAASNPSWSKLKNWIEKGRPYSLVAIETLARLIPHPGELKLNELNPRPTLKEPSTIEEMTQFLIEYRTQDNSPRVRKGVEKIINNWEVILGNI